MTDIAIKNAKPKEKDYFLSDMKGLRLLVHRSGAKYFQFRYSYQKKSGSLFSPLSSSTINHSKFLHNISLKKYFLALQYYYKF